MLRADKTSRDARYWLGMSYYQQDNLGDAKKQFRSLTGTFSTFAKAYQGLGLVYLNERNKAFDALKAFRQADGTLHKTYSKHCR